MAKIKLGARPKTFKRVVSFPMLEGGEGTIECVFKYRTRTEFGAFIDRIFADAGEKNAAGDDFSVESLMTKTCDKNADYLLEILDGWNLDEGLSRDSLQQLADECPAAVNAVMNAYRDAVRDGRLGN